MKFQSVVCILIIVIISSYVIGSLTVDQTKLKKNYHIYQTRYKRENTVLGRNSYTRAVQPNIVVMPGTPNTAYGGVPGVNRAPTVVVVPNDFTPMVVNPYVVPTRFQTVFN